MKKPINGLPNSKTFEQYIQEVAQNIFDRIPKSVKMMNGITLKEVKEDIVAVLDKDNHLKSKYSRMEWNVDKCWEYDLGCEECASKIFKDYQRVITE